MLRVLLDPVITILPVFNWSILLLLSTTTAELAVSVPAVWSSIWTYKSPPIVVTAEVLGCPTNSFFEFDEYANSPAPREEGAAELALLLILMVCAMFLS